MKPTYGTVSRYGLVSYSNSLEQIGPISRTIRDTVIILNTITGKDFHDDTTVDKQLEFKINNMDNIIISKL